MRFLAAHSLDCQCSRRGQQVPVGRGWNPHVQASREKKRGESMGGATVRVLER